ncbi:hypothetical protein AVEN_184757-1 [Araneus ventricosus]|uniref:Uncharacterized protein n=1 Tax=Araneus ventricosus TaxID=182803 RepID=A0A4Y2KW61_ARAVE|nr:hypothetical protein AVEN_184757-1 [Araneus ventricosus]
MHHIRRVTGRYGLFDFCVFLFCFLKLLSVGFSLSENGTFQSLVLGDRGTVYPKTGLSLFRTGHMGTLVITTVEDLQRGVVVPYFTCSSPQLDQVQDSARPQKITNQCRTIL